MMFPREQLNFTKPYPGLRPFERTEAKLFFGRANQLNHMLARLEENHFLAVVGSSGSGKSSLVRAGLLPILEQGYLSGAGTDWKFVIMRPGGNPFGNLAAEFHQELAVDTNELDPSDTAFTKADLQTSPRGLLDVVAEAGLDKGVSLLLLVDQFEEIFRFLNRDTGGGREGYVKRAIHDERNEASSFIKLLLTTAEVAKFEELPIFVMFTMRSDFIGTCDEFPDLTQAISDSQYLVPRLNRQQMQEIIEKPLLVHGSNATPDLVNQMLNDIGTDPDQLPLIQHALMRTWFAAKARWSDGDKEKMLNLDDYNKVGRFAGALSQHLEEAWDSLAGEREQRIAQQLFLCLSEHTDEGALVRRIAKISEVADVANAEPDEVIEVVRVFQKDGRNFIMASPPGELSAVSHLDVSHEALLRQWKRLGKWLVKEAKFAGTYRRLVQSAVNHATDADKESLLRGLVLQSALHWRKTKKPTAAWAKRYHGDFEQAMDFLDDSNAQAVTADAARGRRKRIWKTVVAVALIAMLVGTLSWVFDNWEKERKLVEEEDRVLNGLKEMSEDRTSGVYGLLKTGKTADAIDKIREMKPHEALIALEMLKSITEMNSQKICENRRQLVKAYSEYKKNNEGTKNPVDVDNWINPIHKQIARKLEGNPFSLNSNERCLLIKYQNIVTSLGVKKSHDGENPCPIMGVTLMDVTNPNGNVVPLVGHTEKVNSLAFSSDGKTLATAADDGTVMLWDVQNLGNSFVPLVGHTEKVSNLAFSSDGKTLATAADDGTVMLWDVQKLGSLGVLLDSHTEKVSNLAFSSDGKTLTTAAEDGTVILWDVQKLGSSFEPLVVHTDKLNSLALSSDGKMLVTGGGNDGTVMLWNVQNLGSPGVLLDGHAHEVTSAAFSSDGKILVTSEAYSGTVILWDVQKLESPGVPLAGHDFSVINLAIGSNGKMLATMGYDGTVRLWDLQNPGSSFVPLDSYDRGTPSMAFSNDGKTFAYTGSMNLEIWKPKAEPDPMKYLTGDGAWVYARMAAVAREQESTIFQKVINVTKDFIWAFLVFLVLPFFKLTRWLKRSQSMLFPRKPSALRRATASLIDLEISVGFWILTASLMSTTFFRADMLVIVVVILSPLVYLLFSDAIRFKYYRSIGKILLDLRLVHDVAENHHPIGLVGSVKRNAAFAIGTVLISIGTLFIGTLIFLFDIEIFDSLDKSLLLSSLVLILLAAHCLSIIVMRGRTLGDRWSHTQVIDADSEESQRIDVPPRYIRPDPGQA